MPPKRDNKNKTKQKGKQPAPAMAHDTQASASAGFGPLGSAQPDVHNNSAQNEPQPLADTSDSDTEISAATMALKLAEVLARGNQEEIVVTLAACFREIATAEVGELIDGAIDLDKLADGFLSKPSQPPSHATTGNENTAQLPRPHPVQYPAEDHGYEACSECGFIMMEHMPLDCARATNLVAICQAMHDQLHSNAHALQKEIVGKEKHISNLQNTLYAAKAEVRVLYEERASAKAGVQRYKDEANKEKKKAEVLKARNAELEEQLEKARKDLKREGERMEREDQEAEVYFEKCAKTAAEALEHFKRKKEKKVTERLERERLEKEKLEKQKQKQEREKEKEKQEK